MPRDNSRRGSSSRSSRNESWSDSVMDVARERPIAAAAAAAGAAAAGLFLWLKRNQISRQLSNLSDQISDWTESMSSNGQWNASDDTGGLTTSRSGSSNRGNRSTASNRNNRGMSETGGGNASLGAHSGGMGTTTTGSPSGRGRAKDQPTT